MSSSNRTNIPNSLNEHWMPFSSNKDFKKNPRIIVKAEGIHLHTHDGKTLIDGSSGLYCNPLGHGRKEIIEAIKNQLENLDYTMPFQQGYGGSFELATMIAQKTPEDLNKILKVKPQDKIFARCDSFPSFDRKLSSQFDQTNDLFSKLNDSFDLETSNYFQTGILYFDTSIISKNTKKDLLELAKEYPISITNEQGIMNLYFKFIKNLLLKILLML